MVTTQVQPLNARFVKNNIHFALHRAAIVMARETKSSAEGTLYISLLKQHFSMHFFQGVTLAKSLPYKGREAFSRPDTSIPLFRWFFYADINPLKSRRWMRL